MSNSVEARLNGTATTNGKKITGLACTWEPYHIVDDIWEQMLPCAFTPDVLRSTFCCYDHDTGTILADKLNDTLKLEVTNEGLFYEFDYDESDEDHRRAYSKINRGLVNTSSMRFNGAKDSWKKENGKRIRVIHGVAKLVEVGPVVRAVNKNTKAGLRSESDEVIETVKLSYETFIRLEKLKELKLINTI